jgi:hypothetical protein
MDLETVKSVLLEHGWDADERRRIGDALRLVEDNDECRAMAREFDVIRGALRAEHGAVEETPDGGWAGFEGRLRASILEARPRRWPRPAALAAMIGILLITPWIWTMLSQPDREAPSTMTQAPFGPTEEEVGERLGLFREIAALYDHKAGWVLVGNGAVDIGISQVQGPDVEDGGVLRLAVFRGTEMVSQVDVVAASGQVARIQVPLENGRELCYRLHMLPERSGQVGLYAEIRDPSDAAGPLAALSRDLAMKSGQVDGVGELVTPAGKYSVKVAYATDQPEA